VTSNAAGVSGQNLSALKNASNQAGNLIALKKSVDELLTFLVGKSLPLSDIFV